jgi:hypothetical protein
VSKASVDDVSLPKGWREPSRLSQRVAAEATAWGLAWKRCPTPLRIVLTAASVGVAARWPGAHLFSEVVDLIESV